MYKCIYVIWGRGSAACVPTPPLFLFVLLAVVSCVFCLLTSTCSFTVWPFLYALLKNPQFLGEARCAPQERPATCFSEDAICGTRCAALSWFCFTLLLLFCLKYIWLACVLSCYHLLLAWIPGGLQLNPNCVPTHWWIHWFHKPLAPLIPLNPFEMLVNP